MQTTAGHSILTGGSPRFSVPTARSPAVLLQGWGEAEFVPEGALEYAQQASRRSQGNLFLECL